MTPRRRLDVGIFHGHTCVLGALAVLGQETRERVEQRGNVIRDGALRAVAVKGLIGSGVKPAGQDLVAALVEEIDNP